MDEVFEDVMEGLMWGSRADARDNVKVQRRDDGYILVDYGDDEVYFVVSVRQVRRDPRAAPPPPQSLSFAAGACLSWGAAGAATGRRARLVADKATTGAPAGLLRGTADPAARERVAGHGMDAARSDAPPRKGWSRTRA